MIKITFILKKFIVFFFLLAFLLVGIFGCSLFSKRYEKKEVNDFNINTKGKKSLSINNVSGSIKISKNTTDSILRVKAEVITYVSKKELNKSSDELRIKIDTSGNDISFDNEYYKEKRIFHFDIGRKDKINYEISVPQNLDITIENVSGKIDIDNIENNLKIDLVNGDATLSNTPGNVEVEVTNGKIKCDLDSSKGLNLNTVNGSITLNLSGTFSGYFRADCVNGKVVVKDLDFKKYEESKKSFEGKLGESNVNVKLETVNGKIYLNKK